ncbi:hypothetical protein K2173_020723 [Erythroxylum novogranatense]|uniref:OCRE domain-containing protein n=1 Tax=Erythroxylum novogranatense TaxID=1862640 RepID=A0AAV8TNM3_9ROSI|nr:hypothetical protein K2173_020723 [Erythroxylum novogranatense]
MEGGSNHSGSGMLPRSNRKRSRIQEFEGEDDYESEKSKPTMQRKVRFPKGKKVKTLAGTNSDVPPSSTLLPDTNDDAKSDPRLAATERAKHRTQFTTQLFSDDLNDMSAAEVTNYQDNENFVEDGIQIEPFNLDKEREEGYFDAEGNFVEYVRENETKDPWLDSVEVDPRFADKSFEAATNEDDDGLELSSDDIGTMKRRIADVLVQGETVLQALRRLKGSTNNKKEKMSAETQLLFDQLTEDANKLLDHGEYNVYHEKKEVFQREAEGYERLALARGKGASAVTTDGASGTETGASSSIFSTSVVEASGPSVAAAESLSGAADLYDMFAEDDDKPASKLSTESNNLVAGTNSNVTGQTMSNGVTSVSESTSSQDSFVYDENSGYYYSSSLGYYYDPSTGLYCHAASGQWYSFNEETGTYNEIQGAG